MGKFLKAPHYCLIWTVLSTVGFYLVVGISTLTIACFCSGVILSTINFLEEDKKFYEEENNRL
ncbi:hypothetical protein [Bacillus massilinigeriensis]|uniref:hypothetical protein n=1 Tax=Bacillus massilionigeriensis TaxID=1805475 RepID=UPI00096AF3C4|nr:hypothetical protein [Bacillus massilionigeriensis]